MSKYGEENRARFFEKMKDNSFFVVFSGLTPVKRGDLFYKFQPQRNFYYLTGINRPNLVLVMEKREGKTSSTLFLERLDERMAKWVGAVLSEESAKEASGIDKFKFVDEFQSYIERLLFGSHFETLYLDLENRYLKGPVTPDIDFANEVRRRYPAKNIENAYNIIGNLRSIKTETEIEYLRKAVDITGKGIDLILKNLKPGVMEYEMEAYFNFALNHNNTDTGFNTIAATGKNATVLHYEDNCARTKDGELMLFDLGAEYNYYSADVSRTFPVNGNFTPRQQVLYNIVREANEKVIAAMKPGVPHRDLNKIVLDHYAVELKKIGLIENDEDIAKYYYHGSVHPIGLETHDTGDLSDMELAPGMVLTVEPGLYIEEEGLGIRIEDDVLITETGCEILSKDIPKTVEDIEKAMRGN